MSARDAVLALARGAIPATGLLCSCRFERGGIEYYGVETLVESFKTSPIDIGSDGDVVETPLHLAVFDGDSAIIADLAGGNIARLWLLGAGASRTEEPALAVPFDPDLAQAGGDVFFVGGDHPDLAPDAAATVEEFGREIVATADEPRTRAFAIRAFGCAASGAALYAVFRLRPGRNALAGFTMAAAYWSPIAHHIVRDRGGEAQLAARLWTQRLPR